jgi:hypothetical protein
MWWLKDGENKYLARLWASMLYSPRSWVKLRCQGSLLHHLYFLQQCTISGRMTIVQVIDYFQTIYSYMNVLLVQITRKCQGFSTHGNASKLVETTKSSMTIQMRQDKSLLQSHIQHRLSHPPISRYFTITI